MDITSRRTMAPPREILARSLLVEPAKELPRGASLLGRRIPANDPPVFGARQHSIFLGARFVVGVAITPIQIAVIYREEQAQVRVPLVLWISREEPFLGLGGRGPR